MSLTYYLFDIKTIENSVNKENENELKKLSDLNKSSQIASNLYMGRVIAQLEIKKINLKKALISSGSKLIQKNIDMNNLATTNKLDERNIYVFGHYTNIKNAQLNRIYELKRDDVISLVNNSIHTDYQVIETKEISKNNLYNDSDTFDKLIIVTCTRDFNKDKYYCIYCRKKG